MQTYLGSVSCLWLVTCDQGWLLGRTSVGSHNIKYGHLAHPPIARIMGRGPQWKSHNELWLVEPIKTQWFYLFHSELFHTLPLLSEMQSSYSISRRKAHLSTGILSLVYHYWHNWSWYMLKSSLMVAIALEILTLNT